VTLTTIVTKDHTNILEKTIRGAINTCGNIIRYADKWKYVNMNPDAPRIHGTIKLHKENKPIRPIVNWKNSPRYKLASHLGKLLKSIINYLMPSI
jgi:hypothetical protein